mmetsp:Transcript_94016/g.245282  ORF Transcript_94016/g.245282 Transcript_94016/m.245282 type:complete len:108 (+) Transcript_94016:743-1066(+)
MYSSTESWTNVVDRTIGVKIAPVTGSGEIAACTRSVPTPNFPSIQVPDFVAAAARANLRGATAVARVAKARRSTRGAKDSIAAQVAGGGAGGKNVSRLGFEARAKMA